MFWWDWSTCIYDDEETAKKDNGFNIHLKKAEKILPKGYQKGLDFWKEMFIPVIIAMSASQNVVSALDGGVLALTAGVGVVIVAFLLVPVFNKFTSKTNDEGNKTEVEA